MTITTWNRQLYSLKSFSSANYPLLRSFSITCGDLQDSYYEWTSFESLSIHNMHYLETISIGAKTIPNTKYLSLLSKKHCMSFFSDLPKLRTVELNSVINVYSFVLDSNNIIVFLFPRLAIFEGNHFE